MFDLRAKAAADEILLALDPAVMSERRCQRNESKAPTFEAEVDC